MFKEKSTSTNQYTEIELIKKLEGNYKELDDIIKEISKYKHLNNPEIKEILKNLDPSINIEKDDLLTDAKEAEKEEKISILKNTEVIIKNYKELFKFHEKSLNVLLSGYNFIDSQIKTIEENYKTFLNRNNRR